MDLGKLKEKQQSNMLEFNSLKEKLNQLKILKQDINNKQSIDTEKEERDIQKTMENSLSQLQKNKKRQASKSQKSSSEQLTKLEEKLKKQQKKKIKKATKKWFEQLS